MPFGRTADASQASSLYQYRQTKSKAEAKPQIEQLIWLGTDQSAALAKGAAISTGVNFAKELGNLPPNICTPSYLAKQAKSWVQMAH